ncbi:DUF397 domain-containing protein [Saccharopolyspora sp. ASAGF58]|nr:DUF397 domain-containing protein [Saccharopolyspora sp. ASAGF58]
MRTSRWRKSSYSAANGSCIEVANFENWQKSNYSGQSGSCVEVGQVVDLVGMRDSKLGNDSPVLTVSRVRWADFVAAVKGGGFQRS